MKLAFAFTDISQAHIDELCIYLYGHAFWEVSADECRHLLLFIADIQSLYIQHWMAHHE